MFLHFLRLFAAAGGSQSSLVVGRWSSAKSSELNGP
jgi:hypothetical protein